MASLVTSADERRLKVARSFAEPFASGLHGAAVHCVHSYSEILNFGARDASGGAILMGRTSSEQHRENGVLVVTAGTIFSY